MQPLVPALQIGLTAGEAGLSLFKSLLLPADGLSSSLCLLHSDTAGAQQGTDQVGSTPPSPQDLQRPGIGLSAGCHDPAAITQMSLLSWRKRPRACLSWSAGPFPGMLQAESCMVHFRVPTGRAKLKQELRLPRHAMSSRVHCQLGISEPTLRSLAGAQLA